MTTKIIGCLAELLAITFAFFVVGMLLTITGFGTRLYGIERAQGTYIMEFFWGMASAGGFLQVAFFFANMPLMGAAVQILLPPVLGWFAMWITMSIVGVGEVLIYTVAGKRNEPMELFGIAILCLGIFFLAVRLQRGMVFTAPTHWLYLIAPCLIGMIWAIHLSPEEANKFAVAASFAGGFAIYALAKIWGGRDLVEK